MLLKKNEVLLNKKTRKSVIHFIYDVFLVNEIVNVCWHVDL